MLKPAACLAITVLATPALAGPTIAHPDAPVFEACAANMPEDWNVVVERLTQLGWREVPYTEDLRPLDRDYERLQLSESAVSDGDLTPTEWQAVSDEMDSFEREGGYFEWIAKTESDATRIFRAWDSADTVVLWDDGTEWICHILLREPPADAATFMATRHRRDDDRYLNGYIDYLWTIRGPREKFEFLELLPFLPTPNLYWATYYHPHNDRLEAVTGERLTLGFVAEIGNAYAY